MTWSSTVPSSPSAGDTFTYGGITYTYRVDNTMGVWDASMGGASQGKFTLTANDVYSSKTVDTAYSNTLGYSAIVTVSTGQISTGSNWLARIYIRTTAGPGSWILVASASAYLYGLFGNMVAVVPHGYDYKVTHNNNSGATDASGLGSFKKISSYSFS